MATVSVSANVINTGGVYLASWPLDFCTHHQCHYGRKHQQSEACSSQKWRKQILICAQTMSLGHFGEDGYYLEVVRKRSSARTHKVPMHLETDWYVWLMKSSVDFSMRHLAGHTYVFILGFLYSKNVYLVASNCVCLYFFEIRLEKEHVLWSTSSSPKVN